MGSLVEPWGVGKGCKGTEKSAIDRGAPCGKLMRKSLHVNSARLRIPSLPSKLRSWWSHRESCIIILWEFRILLDNSLIFTNFLQYKQTLSYKWEQIPMSAFENVVINNPIEKQYTNNISRWQRTNNFTRFRYICFTKIVRDNVVLRFNEPTTDKTPICPLYNENVFVVDPCTQITWYLRKLKITQ